MASIVPLPPPPPLLCTEPFFLGHPLLPSYALNPFVFGTRHNRLFSVYPHFNFVLWFGHRHNAPQWFLIICIFSFVELRHNTNWLMTPFFPCVFWRRQAPPVKLSTLTYLSFHLERLVMHSTVGLHSPFITISVHDSRGRRVSRLEINDERWTSLNGRVFLDSKKVCPVRMIYFASVHGTFHANG